LAPWAYGSVDAWAEMLLFGGATLLAALRTMSDWKTRSRSRPAGLASLVLLGLVSVALVQTVPINAGLLKAIAPWTFALRGRLVPSSPETVKGDLGSVVRLPAPTISVEPDSTFHVAAELAA